jgi:hypothetical protein
VNKNITKINEKIILQNYFLPKHKTQLIRLGQDNDGGYLIPVKSIESTKNLYSFGLNDDFSFEKDFSNKKDISIDCYDYSVDKKFWLKRLIRDLKNLLLFKIKKNELKKIFYYFSYKAFFNSNKFVHHKKFIAPVGTKIVGMNEYQISDLDIILKNTTNQDIFLKIDIEGSEYRILDQIIKYQSLFTGMVIEFHECDLHKKTIKDFMENFDLQLVHVHVNNWGLINTEGFPASLELTFSPRKFNQIMNDTKDTFPRTLDQPCNPLFQDTPVQFE